VKVSVLKPLLMFVHRTLDREAPLTTSVENPSLKYIFDYRSKNDFVMVRYRVNNVEWPLMGVCSARGLSTDRAACEMARQ
jgi:hypothetical protein